MQISPELIRHIEDTLIAERKGIRKTIQGVPQIEFQCVEHADEHQSAHWHPRKLVWKCRACPAGGGMLALAKALNINVEAPSAPKKRRSPAAGQKPVRTYTYTHIDGGQWQKERYEFPGDIDPDTGKPAKTFAWSPRFPEGVAAKDMQLYFLEDPAARPDDPILFVEGEKTAEACWQRQLLACTGGWGSSIRDFNPQVFEVLRGREVWLSADNDRAGAEYMDAISASLRGIAGKLRRVSVALPPKGDLVEYFAGGGDPAAIFTGGLDETAVEVVDYDTIRVRIPSELGVVGFVASNLTRGAHALDCKLKVAPEGPVATRPYVTRINLLSTSARTQLRLELSKMFEGFKTNWTELINDAISCIDDAYSNQDVSQDAFDIDEGADEELFLFGDLLPLNQPTIFFGDGGSLKSYLALFCGTLFCLGDSFPGQSVAPDPGKVMYCDFENVTAKGFKRRVRRLFAAAGVPGVYPDSFIYWPGRGVPLLQQLDAIREKVRKDNIRLLIVDSAATAINGKPEDAEVVTAFFNGLATINATIILIAHINRDGDKSKPFGSAFWSNLARRTWYISRVGHGDRADVGLFCRKVNDGPMGEHKALGVEFVGLNGEVRFVRKAFSEVDRALDRERPMGVRLRDALGPGPMTANALATHLASKPETVLAWLKRYPNEFIEMGSSDGKPSEWGLRARESA